MTLDAAVSLDREFALKERVSTTLTLAPELHESPAGQALISDAMKRCLLYTSPSPRD